MCHSAVLGKSGSFKPIMTLAENLAYISQSWSSFMHTNGEKLIQLLRKTYTSCLDSACMVSSCYSYDMLSIIRLDLFVEMMVTAKHCFSTFIMLSFCKTLYYREISF